MVPILRSLRVMSFTLLVFTSLIIFPACSINNSNPSPVPKIYLVVGGKQDIEAQLLTEMYVLLLRNAGFDVKDKAALGGNDDVFNAITHDRIDLYPEFTADGLARLKIASTGNPEQDYQNIKQGYERKYHITWLDVAPLNDTYAICTLKTTASQLGTSLSQLAPVASTLTIATPPDGPKDPNALPGLRPTYGITFGKQIVLAEEKTFQAVIHGQADVNVCYTTSPLISQYNFVQLTDDKHSFPDYFPAPIVRDDTLQKAPQIRTILNRLAPNLTSDVSTMLQSQVATGLSPTDVARNWLKSQGLLA
jgi:osmoprotectant transport system substrate-binding protein